MQGTLGCARNTSPCQCPPAPKRLPLAGQQVRWRAAKSRSAPSHFLMHGSIETPKKLSPPEQKNLCAWHLRGVERLKVAPVSRHRVGAKRGAPAAFPSACGRADHGPLTTGWRQGRWAPCAGAPSPRPAGGAGRGRRPAQQGQEGHQAPRQAWQPATVAPPPCTTTESHSHLAALITEGPREGVAAGRQQRRSGQGQQDIAQRAGCHRHEVRGAGATGLRGDLRQSRRVGGEFRMAQTLTECGKGARGPTDRGESKAIWRSDL